MALSDVSFDSGLSKHKFGNSNIRYSPDGRILSDDNTLSLPRGRNYGGARDYSDYPRSNKSADLGDRREKARQAFYEYHGAYPSYESQSVQRQPPAAPASSYMSRDRRDERPQRNQSPQGRPMSGHFGTGFDEPITAGWHRNDHSPTRSYGDRSQGYNTRDNNMDLYPGSTSYAPSYSGYSPRAQRKGLPRDPYNSYNNPKLQKPDWHAQPGVENYHYDKTGLIAVRNRNGEYGILGKWYSRRKDSPWSVLFLTLGLFILLCGLINVLICLDYHYYCRFWAGFIILEFGMFGLIHSGDWKSGWKSYCYILLGVCSVLAAFTSTALLFEKYIPQIITLANLDNTTAYEEVQKARTDDPHVTIEDDAWVWICFGFDMTTFCLFALSYLAGPAAASCANRFYNFNWKGTSHCEPFTKPKWFNPYGQIPLGEIMAFVGICARYGCISYQDDTDWYKFWSPVWAGALTAIAGAVAAGACKRADDNNTILLAVFLELIAGAGAVVAVVFSCIGLSDNLKTIEDVSNLPSQTEDHLTASACIYAFCAAVCLVQVVYSFVLLIRLFGFLVGRRERMYNRGARRRESTRSLDNRSHSTITTQRDRYGRYSGGANFSSNYWRY